MTNAESERIKCHVMLLALEGKAILFTKPFVKFQPATWAWPLSASLIGTMSHLSNCAKRDGANGPDDVNTFCAITTTGVTPFNSLKGNGRFFPARKFSGPPANSIITGGAH